MLNEVSVGIILEVASFSAQKVDCVIILEDTKDCFCGLQLIHIILLCYNVVVHRCTMC